MRTRSSRHSHRLRHLSRLGERGAVMVEGAIVAIVLFALIFSIFQAAFISRAYLSARYGATGGARAGAVAGNDVAADGDILAAIDRALKVTSRNNVVGISVFKASADDTPVPTSCKTQSVNTATVKCNFYTGNDLATPLTSFTSSYTADNFYGPDTRTISRLSGSDYLGVYVQIRTNALSPLPTTVSYTSIVRLEASEA